MIDKLTSTEQELEARELLEETHETGSTPMGRCLDGERVRICGTVRTVTLRPRAGVPALEAELYDGSGTVAVVWLGRRRIAGIEPGKTVVAEGRITRTAGRAVMYNPRYELLAPGSA